MEKAVAFWAAVFRSEPHKNSQYWSEFRCENINFGLLWMEGFETLKDRSNCVPVFELSDAELENIKNHAVASGAVVIVDITEHPDKMSYVLADPFGNEFELTRFHD
jgi:hypothetical protein